MARQHSNETPLVLGPKAADNCKNEICDLLFFFKTYLIHLNNNNNNNRIL